MFKKKSQVWVSAVLYVLISVVVLVIVVELGTPLLESLKDKSIFVRTKDNFLTIDKQIKDVSEEGFGSQRVIPLEIQKGDVEVSENNIKWSMKTDADIIEPGSSVEIGNLVVAANSDVSAKKHGESFILENSAILINFSSIANDSQWSAESIDPSTLINYIEYKTANGKIRHTGTFSFDVKNSGSPLSAGNGYTKLLNEGDFLTSASLILHINSSVEYDLKFTLNSRADFLQVDVVNRKD